MNFLWSLTLIGRMENIYHLMQIGVFATFTLSTGIKNVIPFISEDTLYCIYYVIHKYNFFFIFLSPMLTDTYLHFQLYNSVLVHSGGLHGGHYYAYIRPTLSEQWYAVKTFFFPLIFFFSTSYVINNTPY